MICAFLVSEPFLEVVPSGPHKDVFSLNWNFLFDAMAKMGMVQEFNKMVKSLFKYATKAIYLNGCITKSFKIVSKGAQISSLPSFFLL
jgi:hypothetical protein